MLLFSCAGKQWLETVFYGLVLDSDSFCPRGVGSAAVARAPVRRACVPRTPPLVHTRAGRSTRPRSRKGTERRQTGEMTQLDRRRRKRNRRLLMFNPSHFKPEVHKLRKRENMRTRSSVYSKLHGYSMILCGIYRLFCIT